MHNGHRVPLSDELSHLIGISRALGRVEGTLGAIDKRMDRQDTIMIDTAERVRHLEGRMTDPKPSRFKRLSDAVRLAWPFLLLGVAIISRIKTGSADWLLPFVEHVKIQ